MEEGLIKEGDQLDAIYLETEGYITQMDTNTFHVADSEKLLLRRCT